MNDCFYLKMADSLRDSGLDLIREYIPDSPVCTPEDEPSQYNIPYVPSLPVYPTPAYNPPTPEYTPSAITTVPELDLIDMKKEENIHIKFLDPPASPTPSGMPSEHPNNRMYTSNSLIHQHHPHPVIQPVEHLTCNLHLCSILHLQLTPFTQNPLDYHRVCLYQYT